MAPKPEEQARTEIDRLLTAAGWSVQRVSEANIHAAQGVALREFPLKEGHGFADYMLYVDGKAVGVIEAKKMGHTLSGVEIQSTRYVKGLPDALPFWRKPLPFAYESTGAETCFTNGLDPEPRARRLFAFHRPDALAQWLAVPEPEKGTGKETTLQDGSGIEPRGTFLYRVPRMPELVTEWGEHKLWPAQIAAIRNLEKSLAANKPRALIQMATGSGKTFTAISNCTVGPLFTRSQRPAWLPRYGRDQIHRSACG